MKYFSKPVQDIIKSRKSVRSYDNKALADEIKKKIIDYIDTIKCPFDNEVRIIFLDKTVDDTKGAKIGTYGFIKGAKHFLAAIILIDDIHSYVQLGFKFEQLILFAKDLGLGTVWLGGTFNKGQFSKAANLTQNEIMPIVSPIGFPTDKKSFIEKLMRKIASGDNRKAWGELFFDGDFNKSLSRRQAGKFGPALEMLRLAPSAMNAQPWRIIKEHNNFHFYNSKPNFKMHDIDIGICMCHFELTLNEAEIKGSWKLQKPEIQNLPRNYDYIITWCGE
jgi:hypothetical protein